VRPAATAKKGVRNFENAAGLRLLDRSTGQERRFFGDWRFPDDPWNQSADRPLTHKPGRRSHK
jgi:hypothetical protein